MTDATVREATAEDADAIREIAETSWEVDYPDILTRETIEEGVREWYGSDRLGTEITRSFAVVLVAEADDEVVGFVHAVRSGDQGDLLRLYVAPDHRGEGIGSSLLDRACEVLAERGADWIRAMVLAANDRGRAFYEAAGFELDDADGVTVIGGQRYPECTYRRAASPLADAGQ